jgi:hypothetical protein
LSDIKKGDDEGQVVLRKDGKPICSIHGNSLWIEESNVANNDAFCMHSDKTIPASDKVRLTKAHISIKNIPKQLDDIAGGLRGQGQDQDG